jgi:hypothetical protein
VSPKFDTAPAVTVTLRERDDLDDLELELLTLHRPRIYPAGRGQTVTRCISCAVPSRSRDLRRADWPCATARALGVTS